jgi:hypothetical protein
MDEGHHQTSALRHRNHREATGRWPLLEYLQHDVQDGVNMQIPVRGARKNVFTVCWSVRVADHEKETAVNTNQCRAHKTTFCGRERGAGGGGRGRKGGGGEDGLHTA